MSRALLRVMTSSPTITYAVCSSCFRLNRVPLTPKSHQQPICGSCKSPLPIHGAVIELSGSTLRELVAKSPLPVVVDFWASWCGPCKVFAPVFDAVSKELAGEVVFAKLDTEAHAQAANAHSIRGIPTLILFDRSQEKSRQSGAMPQNIFADWIRSEIRRVHAA